MLGLYRPSHVTLFIVSMVSVIVIWVAMESVLLK